MSLTLADRKNKINAKLQTHQKPRSSHDGAVGLSSGLEMYGTGDGDLQAPRQLGLSV